MLWCFVNADLESRYAGLCGELQQSLDNSQKFLHQRKQLEADVCKVEQWLEKFNSSSANNVDFNLPIIRLSNELAKHQVQMTLCIIYFFFHLDG